MSNLSTNWNGKRSWWEQIFMNLHKSSLVWQSIDQIHHCNLTMKLNSYLSGKHGEIPSIVSWRNNLCRGKLSQLTVSGLASPRWLYAPDNTDERMILNFIRTVRFYRAASNRNAFYSHDRSCQVKEKELHRIPIAVKSLNALRLSICPRVFGNLTG